MFYLIKEKVRQQFNILKHHQLYQVALGRDTLVDAYLAAFPEEEKQGHNCNCCKSFLRQYGNIVTIIDGTVHTLWDFSMEGIYSNVPDSLGSIVRNAAITDVFASDVVKLGTDKSLDRKLSIGDSLHYWQHFYLELPKQNVYRGSIDTLKGEQRTKKETTKRSLDSITVDSVETVLELINQNSLYRGAEFKGTLERFLVNKKAYDKLGQESKELFCWTNRNAVLNIRNTVIGTLLDDLSSGRELDSAVTSYEAKVAPSNYRRPTALVTKGMIEQAEKTIVELGLEPALARKYAVKEDISVNDVLFVNRDKPSDGLFDKLKNEVAVNPKLFSRVEEVPVETFIKAILPTTDSIDVLLENKHCSNFMSLIAPVNVDAPSLFSWDNNFSWSYANNLTDSMKERVKAAGGKVEGALRFSIQWNDNGDNNTDFDAHAIEPDGHEIYFSNKGRQSRLSGMLDVDIINPEGKVAVENIIWERTPFGVTKLFVHNYSSWTSKGGFTAEIEYEGQVYSYSYGKSLRGGESVTVAVVEITKDGLKFRETMANNVISVSKEVWGLNTNNFHKVSMVLNSPNHWGDKPIGNKHTFFILDKAKNDSRPRGIFNEFLKPELNQHRKVFEVLGNKLKVEDSDHQLSGLGFSSTQRAEVICRVTGKTTRIIKVQF